MVQSGKPPQIKIKYENNTLSIIDRGVGMSKEFMFNNYTRAGYSTKTDTNSQIGNFGIGKMAIFSYLKTINEHSYYVISTHKGITCTYIVTKESGIPKVILLSEEEIGNEDGVTVSFTTTESKYNLAKAIESELRFFDNIEIEGLYVTSNTLYKGKHFIICDGVSSNPLKACSGKNVYSIDTKYLKGYNNPYRNSHIYLYFDIGELDLLENREEIKYTPHSIKSIEEKYKLATEELQGLYSTTLVNENKIIPYLKENSNNDKYIIINDKPFSLTHFKITNILTTKYPAFFDVVDFSDIMSTFSIINKKNLKLSNLHKGVYCEGKGFSGHKLSYNNKEFNINLAERKSYDDLSYSYKLKTNKNIDEELYNNVLDDLALELKEILTDINTLPSKPSYKTKYPENKIKALTYNKYETILTKEIIEKGACKIIFSNKDDLYRYYTGEYNGQFYKDRSFYISKTEFKKLKDVRNHVTIEEWEKSKEFEKANIRGTLRLYKTRISGFYRGIIKEQCKYYNSYLSKNNNYLTIKEFPHPLIEMGKSIYNKILKISNEKDVKRLYPEIYSELIQLRKLKKHKK